MSRIIQLQPGAGVQSAPNLPPEEGPDKLRVHTPDPKAYHAVAGGTMIRRSKRGKFSGAPLGFEPNSIPFGVVEYSPGGSSATRATVVPKNIKPDDAADIYAKIAAEVDDPDEVIIRAYQALGINVQNNQSELPQPPEQSRFNDLMSGYVVPKYDTLQNKDQRMGVPPKIRRIQDEPREQPQVEPSPAAAPPVQQQPQAHYAPQQPTTPYYPQQSMPPQYYMPQPQVAMPPWVEQAIEGYGQAIASLQTQVSELVTALSKGTSDKREPVPQPVVEAEPVSESSADKSSESRLYSRDELVRLVDQTVSKAFEALGIPGLSTSAKAPRCRVEFNLGDRVGRMTASYHWVVEEGDGLFLIYDTRFEHGSFYVPPFLGEERITVKLGNGNSYRCCSPDFVQPFGVFRIVNLLIDRRLQQPAEEVESTRQQDGEDNGGSSLSWSELNRLIGAE